MIKLVSAEEARPMAEEIDKLLPLYAETAASQLRSMAETVERLWPFAEGWALIPCQNKESNGADCREFCISCLARIACLARRLIAQVEPQTRKAPNPRTVEQSQPQITQYEKEG